MAAKGTVKGMKRVAILTVSDTRSSGSRADTTTPLIMRLLKEADFTVERTSLVADKKKAIQKRLIWMADQLKLPLIITTGGTGLGMRDVTPEATKAVTERDVPGLPEAMRVSTSRNSPFAWLSRGVAGIRGRTLIVNLPGSRRAVEECMRVLLPILPHALFMIEGRPHEYDTVCMADS